MKTSNLFNLLLLAVLVIGLSFCDKSVGPDDNILPQYTFTADDSSEAFELSVWFSGQLVPHDSLTGFFLYSLKKLRLTYSESVDSALQSTRFISPWKLGEVSVRFDSLTALKIDSGTYQGWNQLDPSLLPDTTLSHIPILGWYLFGFNRSYNPRRLADAYRLLPGAQYANPNALGPFSGFFPLHPGFADGEMTYLFVSHAFAEVAGRTYFFRYLNGQPVYLGTWSRSMSPQPDWYSLAKTNVDSIYSWDGPP